MLSARDLSNVSCAREEHEQPLDAQPEARVAQPAAQRDFARELQQCWRFAASGREARAQLARPLLAHSACQSLGDLRFRGGILNRDVRGAHNSSKMLKILRLVSKPISKYTVKLKRCVINRVITFAPLKMRIDAPSCSFIIFHI